MRNHFKARSCLEEGVKHYETTKLKFEPQINIYDKLGGVSADWAASH